MFGFKPQVPTIAVEKLKQALDEKSDIVVLDVRTPTEYARGNIQGSINLPLDDVAIKIEGILPDKNKTIYIYCLSGSRSVVAADTLLKAGYKNVFDVENGLLAWRAKHYPVNE